jgi:hypothetical protein
MEAAWESYRPADVAVLLAPLSVPWWIAGGWAIDLFVGRQTRPHEDIDVMILRRDQEALWTVLHGWELAAASNGKLEVLPSGVATPPGVNSLWARPEGARWTVEFLLADADGDRWVFRRNRSVIRPIRDIGWAADDGLPCVVPEIQLLFKAKDPRPVDELDFRMAHPLLTGDARAWLREALSQTHPDRPWPAEL